MQSSAASTSAQRGPSSARVLEFVCLFTHDLKRKQKRWQDGRLKFHAFNNRIMVYDERGNFIGDTHWREDYEFGDGEEVQLERGGVIVQAAECVASHNQDLSELIDKRLQEKVQRQSAAAARHSRPVPSGGVPVIPPAATPHFQLRHTPLHNLLGAPTGHHGRALVPSQSPFEERQRLNAEQSPAQPDESPHPSKRRKREPLPASKSGYAQSLFGATLTLSGRPTSSAPVLHKPCSSKPHQHQHNPSSSGVSSEDGDEEDVQEVSPPTTTGPQKSFPLYERPAASSNVPRAQPDALVGKDARSNASVPLLLRQTRPDLAKAIPEPVEATPARPKEINQFSRAEEEFERAHTEKATKTVPQKRGAMDSAVDQTRSKIHPPPRSSQGRSRVRVTKEQGDTSDTIGSTSMQLSTSKHETGAAQSASVDSAEQIIVRVGVGRKSADTLSKKPAVREPRIELRIAPSKKRGLLMLSERGAMKKARKSSKAQHCDDPGYSGSSQTVLSDHGGGSLIESSGDASKRGRDGYMPTKEANEPAIQKLSADQTSKPMGHGASKADNVVLNIDELDAAATHISRAAGVTSSGTSNNVRKRHGKGPVESRSRSLEENTNEINRDLVLPEEDNEEQVGMFAGEQLRVSTPSRSTRGQRKKHLRSPEKRSTRPSQACGVDPAETQGLEKGEGPDGPVNLGHDSNDSADRPRDYERDFDEMFSKRPENAPPPRLAQLSRKSVRSREVIGLFYGEDDEPPAQSKSSIRVAQTTASNMQQELQAAASSSGKDKSCKVPVQVNGEAKAGSFPPSEHQRPNSSHKPPDMAVYRASPMKQKAGMRLLSPTEAESSNQQNQIRSVRSEALKADVRPKLPAELRATTISSGQTDPPVPWSVGTDKESSGMTQKYKSASALRRRALAGDYKDEDTPGRHNGSMKARSDTEMTDPSCKLPTSSPDMSLDRHVPECHVQETESTAAVSKTVAKIVNPATRGRKAAKPSDAAGQVPENILPPDNRALAPRAQKAPKGPPSALPGFSKANGGPWSREAYDLFEYKRPE